MTELTLDEVKRIQVEILSAVHSFCCDNNITYSVACGTLLGAIRHKGYIPWDDDIDIYLRREDFERLEELFPESIYSRYSFVSLNRSRKWGRPYGKIYDSKTLFYDGEEKTEDIGINIDVYPIDKVPDNYRKWQIYNKLRRGIIHLYEVKYIPLSTKRGFFKNSILILLKGLTIFFSKRQMALFVSRIAQLFNNKSYSYSFENVQGMLVKKRFPSDLFNNIVEIPFEEIMVMAFDGYDRYLVNAYGDYMKLPPESKRVSHHIFKAYYKG